MRIMHLCLANFYIDNYNYQENILARINMEDGHEVMVIASTETFINYTHLGYVESGEYYTNDKIHIKRLPYKRYVNDFMSRKIRKYIGLYDELEKFAPDVIMSHDICFLSVLDVVRYKKKHPKVKLYADTHTAVFNSGQNWVSLHLLHRGFYRWVIKKAVPYLEKYFYTGVAEKEFNMEHYKIKEDIMEFYPSGGICIEEDRYQELRKKYRSELHLEANELLIVHSGKIDSLKKTDVLIKAFTKENRLHGRLIILGSIKDEEKAYYDELIQADDRIQYLGWKNTEELNGYLCAADLYCQPGSVSVTLQNAVCCNAPVMTYPFETYKLFDRGNFIWVETGGDIEKAFTNMAEGEVDLESMRERAKKSAHEVLDYRKLARRLYE